MVDEVVEVGGEGVGYDGRCGGKGGGGDECEFGGGDGGIGYG